MGTPEGLSGLIEEINLLAKRIESGEIPKSAMPKFFFPGHEVLHGYTGNVWFKCSCGHTWSISESVCHLNYQKDKKIQYQCPSCGKTGKDDDNFWYVEHNHVCKWQCLECKHQWISEDGTVCPLCKLDHKDWKKKT